MAFSLENNGNEEEFVYQADYDRFMQDKDCFWKKQNSENPPNNVDPCMFSLYIMGEHWGTPKFNGSKLFFSCMCDRLSLYRLRLSRITAYLEVKIWFLF